LVPMGNAQSAATLRISEVMSDPAEPGRDAPTEWLELVNYGEEPIDLAGWRIEDASSGDVLTTAMILPGAYLVVAGGAAAFADDVAVMRVADGEIGNGLANGGDLLRLVHPGGEVVDAISFGENQAVFQPGPPAPGSGATIGLRAFSGAGATSWQTTLRPTPGEPNVFETTGTAVAGVMTAAPAQSGSTPSATATTSEGDGPPVEDDDGGGSITPWLILGGLAGLTVGMGYAALAPRIKKWREKRRGR
jgi:hypothetical protein